MGTIDSATGVPPAAAFHPTEPWLDATYDIDQVAIYTLDNGELMENARSRLPRDSAKYAQLYLRRSCGEETLRDGRPAFSPLSPLSVSRTRFGREMLRNNH